MGAAMATRRAQPISLPSAYRHAARKEDDDL